MRIIGYQSQPTLRSSACLIVLVLSLLFAQLVPSERINAGAVVTCQGNNLQVAWDGLLTPVTVRVNGTDAVTGGPASGTTLIGGPGSWTVEIFQNGDPVGTYAAGCPGSQPAPRDPNRIDNGSDAGLNVPFKRKGGGFDLYTYNPTKQNSVLLFSVSCEQQAGAARQSAQQHAQGQIPNVHLFTGKDYQGREVTVWFVYPDQIQVNGYFDDGKPHVFNFAACADARQLAQLAVPTPTSVARPQLTITASCKGNIATFVVTNNGGDMREPGRYVISVPPARIVGGAAIQLQAGASESLTVQGHYTTLTAIVHSGGGASVQAQTTCERPKLTVKVICNTNAYVVAVTNGGGDMIADGELHVRSFAFRGDGGSSSKTPLRVAAGATVNHEFPYDERRISGTVYIDNNLMQEFTCGTDPILVLGLLCNDGKVSFAIQNNTGSHRQVGFAAQFNPLRYNANNIGRLIEETIISMKPWEVYTINPMPVQRGTVVFVALDISTKEIYTLRKSC